MEHLTCLSYLFNNGNCSKSMNILKSISSTINLSAEILISYKPLNESQKHFQFFSPPCWPLKSNQYLRCNTSLYQCPHYLQHVTTVVRWLVTVVSVHWSMSSIVFRVIINIVRVSHNRCSTSSTGVSPGNMMNRCRTCCHNTFVMMSYLTNV